MHRARRKILGTGRAGNGGGKDKGGGATGRECAKGHGHGGGTIAADELAGQALDCRAKYWDCDPIS
jgi:hypothetical protein